MRFIPTKIPAVVVIEPDIFEDSRGFFMETWQVNKFTEGGITANFVQDNHSRSNQGTLRGLHYQVKQPQGKLIRVLAGKIFDIAVDLRRNSPSFGQWVGEIISDENKKMLWIPEGFAHGFYVLSETADFFYKCTDFYNPECERTLRWDDPDLAIDWPLINGETPNLAAKDAKGALLKDAEYFE